MKQECLTQIQISYAKTGVLLTRVLIVGNR